MGLEDCRGAAAPFTPTVNGVRKTRIVSETLPLRKDAPLLRGPPSANASHHRYRGKQIRREGVHAIHGRHAIH